MWPQQAGVVPTFRAATSEPWATRRTPGHGPFRVLQTLPARRPQQHPRLRTEYGALHDRQALMSLTAVLTCAAKGAVATIHDADARRAQLPHKARASMNSRCIRTGVEDVPGLRKVHLAESSQSLQACGAPMPATK